MADQNRPRTVMETDEEIRAALLESNASGIVSRAKPHGKQPPPIPQEPEPSSAEVVIAKGSSTRAYRPTLRPPTPILVVCDDGSMDGEIIRLRAEKFVIGRTTGDFLIQHDGLVSSRHVEIIRVLSDGRWRWLLVDLKSTHGTYFRFTSHQLVDQQEFLVGRSRFRFEQKGPPPNAATPPRTDYTIGWTDESTAAAPPTLVEIARNGSGKTLELRGEVWIGSDHACQFSPQDDPFLEPRHAKIHQHPKKGWVVENNKTQNGVWVRRDQYVLDPSKESQANSIRFQIGEQQFKLMVQS